MEKGTHENEGEVVDLVSAGGPGSVGVTTRRHTRPRGGPDMGEAWGIAAVRTPRGKGRKDIGTLVHTHGSWRMAFS